MNTRIKKVIPFFFLFFSLSAFAYLPPCSYIVKKFTSGRTPKKNAIVYVTIFRPAENTKSTDEQIGERVYFYGPETEIGENAWPALSLLFEANGEKLLEEMRSFGFTLPMEKELLLQTPEQYMALQEVPNPFYAQDKEVSLRRYKTGYTWTCENKQKDCSLWVEKDTFVPLELRAPCPDGIGGGDCAIEFQNAWNLHDTKNARLLVKRGDKYVYLLKIDHVVFNPSSAQWKQARESAEKLNADKSLAGIDGFLH